MAMACRVWPWVMPVVAHALQIVCTSTEVDSSRAHGGTSDAPSRDKLAGNASSECGTGGCRQAHQCRGVLPSKSGRSTSAPQRMATWYRKAVCPYWAATWHTV